jgi:excisionase family DNA binding protein
MATLFQIESEDKFTESIRSIIREELAILNTKETPQRFLSRQEVAELLKISLPTLNEYTRKGIVKGSRVGSRVLYDEAQIRESVKGIPTLKYKRR